MSAYQKTIEVLTKAKEEIARILIQPIDQNHALRISTSLQKEINTLSLTTGTAQTGAPAFEKLGPAKTVLGVAVSEKKSSAALTPKQQQVDALKAEVNAAYATFATSDSETILTNVNELVIRGVAKKAGMEVTKDNPKKVTVAFVDKVKKAVAKQQQEQIQALSDAQQAVADAEKAMEGKMQLLNEANATGDAEKIEAAQNEVDTASAAHAEALQELEKTKTGV